MTVEHLAPLSIDCEVSYHFIILVSVLTCHLLFLQFVLLHDCICFGIYFTQALIKLIFVRLDVQSFFNVILKYY